MTGSAWRGIVAAVVLVVCLAGSALAWTALGRRPASVVVRPDPSTAEVRVGETVGIGETQVDVTPGRISVRVSAPGYLPSEVEVHVTPGSEVVLTPTLVPSTAR